MKLQRTAAAVMTLAMSFAAMAMGSQPQVSKLDGSKWMLAELGSDGSISGYAGCNRYSGAYAADAAQGRIKAGPFLATRMHCVEPARRMEQEE